MFRWNRCLFDESCLLSFSLSKRNALILRTADGRTKRRLDEKCETSVTEAVDRYVWQRERVCVCVRERERVREKWDRWRVELRVFPSDPKQMFVADICAHFREREWEIDGEREREGERERKWKTDARFSVIDQMPLGCLQNGFAHLLTSLTHTRTLLLTPLCTLTHTHSPRFMHARSHTF